MSKSPGLYSHIGKKARDVLFKDYAQQSRTHFQYQSCKWNFDISCETPEILPGFSVLFQFSIPDSSKVELRFWNRYVGIASSVGVKADEEGAFHGTGYDPVASLSGQIGNNLFSIGTGVAFDLSTKEVDEFGARLGLNAGLFLPIALTLEDKFDTVKASCHHEFNSVTNTALAAEVKYCFSESSTTFTVGAQHALFPFALLKAHGDSEGRVGGLVRFELWKKLLVAFSGEVDLRSSARISKFGFSTAFTA